jgi:carbamate kinase
MEHQTPHPLAVVAVGGSELIQKGQPGTHREQIRASRRLARSVITLLQEGYRVLLVHGNGPQVGRELIRSEEASTKTPPRPLDLCVAATQGTVGELLVREIRNLMRRERIDREVIALHTQVLVSREDPAFGTPSKAIGPLYSEWRARELMKTTKWDFVEEGKDQWRRVVPSPSPLDVMGIDAFTPLLDSGTVVLAGGGGGVPLAVDAKGDFVGVEAVVDKDHTAALMAEHLGAEVLILLTDVDHVYTSFGRPDQTTLEHVTAAELRQLADAGHFPASSIGPKIEASLQFVENGGSTAIITNAEKIAQALADRGGTRISLTERASGVRHQLPLFGDTNNDISVGKP